MEILGALLVLLVPTMAGVVSVRQLIGDGGGPAPWLTSLGFGYFFGVLSLAALLGLQARAGLGLNPWPLLFAVTIVGVVLTLRLPARLRPRHRSWTDSRLEQVLFAFLVLWLAARLGLLGFELLRQPLLTWDAWTTWLLRAKVWVELGQPVAFVAPDVWLTGEVAEAHTTPAWHYPTLVSWIAALPALALGEWSESIAGLTWWLAGVAMGFGVYGSLRALGYRPAIAIAPVFLVLTLPLLNSHIALSGLADLWVTATVGLAFCAFLRATQTGDVRYYALAGVMLLFCVLTKREGVVWAALLVPALLAARSRAWLAGVAAMGLLGVVLLPFVGELELPLVGKFEFVYQTSWRALTIQTLTHGTWHLLIPGFIASLFWAAISYRTWMVDPSMRGGIVWVSGSALLLYVLFFWTDAAAWAETGTAVNRLILHFVVVWSVWMLTIWVPPPKSL